MKKIDYKNPEFWTCDTERKCAKPFPGRYPTRWRLVVLDGTDKVLFDYQGKPSYPTAIRELFKLIKPPSGVVGTVVCMEYDRLGVFRAVGQTTPRHNLALWQYNPVLSYFYYPWSATHRDFTEPWQNGLYHKMLSLGSYKWFVYSPFKKMIGPETERLREYKTWLRKENPLRSLTSSKLFLDKYAIRKGIGLSAEVSHVDEGI